MSSTNSRYTTLKWLIIVAAVTMVPLYIIQGVMSRSLRPDEIWQPVWIIEHFMWGCRAIVEGFVFGYVYSTETTTPEQARNLRWFKVVLLGLIAVTLGATIYATVSGLSIKEALSWAPLRALWSLGLALYLPLMIGAAGYAYKVQPGEVVEQQADPAEILDLRARLAVARKQVDEYQAVQQRLDELQARAAELEAQAQAIPALKLLNASEIARILAQRDDPPPVSDVARVLGKDPSTISKAYKSANGTGQNEI